MVIDQNVLVESAQSTKAKLNSSNVDIRVEGCKELTSLANGLDYLYDAYSHASRSPNTI